MTFKEQIKADVGTVFLNNDEFSDIHTINGKQISVIVDNSELIQRAKITGTAATDGIYSDSILIFVSVAEFPKRPNIGSMLNLDGRDYKVINCTAEGGVYSIELKANRF